MPENRSARGLLGAGQCGPVLGLACCPHLPEWGCVFCVIPPGKGAASDKQVRSMPGAPTAVKAHSYPEQGRASSGPSTASFTVTCPFPGALCSAPVLRPAPGVLPRRVHSRCGSLQGPEAEPLLPREYREPSHRSLFSHRGFAKRLPATSVRLDSVSPPLRELPERGGAGWSHGGSLHRGPSLPAPAAPLPCLPCLVSGTTAKLRNLSPPDGRAPELVGLGASEAFVQALAFPFPKPQSSIWSPGAAEPVPEETERAGKGAILPVKGVRQHVKGGCSFLLCLVRKKKKPHH